ncbi:MAG: hypothetical protein E6R03_08445 [Hyphomicrobiaceae bacterium]|nr:MAG: hypothetical protein E6R03_08445 [Hyphomicrobiaceae bacterium]
MDSLLANLRRSMRNVEVEMLVRDGTPLEVALRLAEETKPRVGWWADVGEGEILPEKYLHRR